jgi:hypothetical protein
MWLPLAILWALAIKKKKKHLKNGKEKMAVIRQQKNPKTKQNKKTNLGCLHWRSLW